MNNQQARCFTCGDEGDCPDCDERAEPVKRIESVFQTQGVRRRLMGFNGFVGDVQVAYEMPTERAAQALSDAYVYEVARRS